MPCTEVNLPIRPDLDPHVLSGDEVVLGMLHVPEVRIGGPYYLGRIDGDVEGNGEVVLEPWVVPPLPHEYIHGVFLVLVSSVNS